MCETVYIDACEDGIDAHISELKEKVLYLRNNMGKQVNLVPVLKKSMRLKYHLVTKRMVYKISHTHQKIQLMHLCLCQSSSVKSKMKLHFLCCIVKLEWM